MNAREQELAARVRKAADLLRRTRDVPALLAGVKGRRCSVHASPLAVWLKRASGAHEAGSYGGWLTAYLVEPAQGPDGARGRGLVEVVRVQVPARAAKFEQEFDAGAHPAFDIAKEKGTTRVR